MDIKLSLDSFSSTQVTLVIIFTPGNSGTLDPLGTFACLLAAVSYAISYVYMAHYLTPKKITATALAAAQLIAATPTLLTGSALVLIGIALSRRTPPNHHARQAKRSRQP